MPRIRIHSLAQARVAVAAAAELGAEVTLESPPGAGGYWGPAYFAAVLRLSGAGNGVLDCADAPGRALAALRAGIKAVRLVGTAPEAQAAVAAIAVQLGARLETVGAPVLDLREVPSRRWAEACRDWLVRAG